MARFRRMRRLPIWRAGLALLGALGGCALGERAELVYLRQLETLDWLTRSIAAAEVERPTLAEELYGLEDRLNAACASLREAGRRRIADQAIEDNLEWAVITSIDDCAQTAADVERRLGRADPETAGDLSADPGFAPAGDLD